MKPEEYWLQPASRADVENQIDQVVERIAAEQMHLGPQQIPKDIRTALRLVYAHGARDGAAAIFAALKKHPEMTLSQRGAPTE